MADAAAQADPYRESARRLTLADLKQVAWTGLLAPCAVATPRAAWPAIAEALSWRARRQLAAQLRVIIGSALPDRTPAEIRALAHDTLRFGIEERLIVLADHLPGGWNGPLRLHGLRQLEKAATAGRGVILWVAYQTFASLLVKMAVALTGRPVHHLSAPTHGYSPTAFGRRWLNPIVTRAEDRYIAERIPYLARRPAAGMRRLRQCLEEGRIVSITAGVGARGLVDLPVLEGRLALRLATGPLRLAAHSGAPVLPVFLDRDADGTFHVTIEPPLDLAGGEAAALEAYGRLASLHLQRTPAVWRVWRHHLWRDDVVAAARHLDQRAV